MKQIEFAHNSNTILEIDDNIINLTMGGTWLINEIDEYSDLDKLKLTIPSYNKQPLIDHLRNSVSLFKFIRASLYDSTLSLQDETEKKGRQ